MSVKVTPEDVAAGASRAWTLLRLQAFADRRARADGLVATLDEILALAETDMEAAGARLGGLLQGFTLLGDALRQIAQEKLPDVAPEDVLRAAAAHVDQAIVAGATTYGIHAPRRATRATTVTTSSPGRLQ